MNELLDYIFEFQMLSDKQKKKTSNGCGPKLAGININVPSMGCAYCEACDLHDYIYWSGGDEEVRKLADIKMFEDMREVNRLQPFYRRAYMFPLPYIYYWAVSRFGSVAFNYTDRRKLPEEISI